MKVSQILAKALKLISDERKWCKGELALNKNGSFVKPRSKNAIKWCVVGAICKMSGTYHEARDSIDLCEIANNNVPLEHFNDVIGHRRVISALKKGIKLAKQLESKKKIKL